MWKNILYVQKSVGLSAQRHSLCLPTMELTENKLHLRRKECFFVKNELSFGNNSNAVCRNKPPTLDGPFLPFKSFLAFVVTTRI